MMCSCTAGPPRDSHSRHYSTSHTDRRLGAPGLWRLQPSHPQAWRLPREWMTAPWGDHAVSVNGMHVGREWCSVQDASPRGVPRGRDGAPRRSPRILRSQVRGGWKQSVGLGTCVYGAEAATRGSRRCCWQSVDAQTVACKWVVVEAAAEFRPWWGPAGRRDPTKARNGSYEAGKSNNGGQGANEKRHGWRDGQGRVVLHTVAVHAPQGHSGAPTQTIARGS